MRGWTKDQRRGVFQIFNGTVLGAALILQIATGFVKLNVLLLALLAMPGTLIGARLGMRTYHALNDRNFYDVVLALLFLSGARIGLEQHCSERNACAWPPCAPSRLLYAGWQSSYPVAP